MPRQHTEVEFLDVVYVHGVEEGSLMGEMGTCDFSFQRFQKLIGPVASPHIIDFVFAGSVLLMPTAQK